MAELAYKYEYDYTMLNVWELEDHEAGTWAVVVNSMTINCMMFQPVTPLEKSLRRFQMGVHPSITSGNSHINVIAFHPYDRDVVYLINNNRRLSRVVRCNVKKGTFKVVLDHHSWQKLILLVNPLVPA